MLCLIINWNYRLCIKLNGDQSHIFLNFHLLLLILWSTLGSQKCHTAIADSSHITLYYFCISLKVMKHRPLLLLAHPNNKKWQSRHSRAVVLHFWLAVAQFSSLCRLNFYGPYYLVGARHESCILARRPLWLVRDDESYVLTYRWENLQSTKRSRNKTFYKLSVRERGKSVPSI